MSKHEEPQCILHGLSRAEAREKIVAVQDEMIAKFGWGVIGVSEDAKRAAPPFAYTVGLTQSFGHPELLIFGVQPEIAQAILNTAGERIRAGRRYIEGDKDAELFAHGYIARFHEVRDYELVWAEFVTAAVAHAEVHGRPRPSVMQIICPDRAGKFFDDPEYDDATMRRVQPILGGENASV